MSFTNGNSDFVYTDSDSDSTTIQCGCRHSDYSEEAAVKCIKQSLQISPKCPTPLEGDIPMIHAADEVFSQFSQIYLAFPCYSCLGSDHII